MLFCIKARTTVASSFETILIWKMISFKACINHEVVLNLLDQLCKYYQRTRNFALLLLFLFGHHFCSVNFWTWKFESFSFLWTDFLKQLTQALLQSKLHSVHWAQHVLPQLFEATSRWFSRANVVSKSVHVVPVSSQSATAPHSA